MTREAPSPGAHPQRAGAPTPEQLRDSYAVGVRGTVFGLMVSAALAAIKVAAGVLGSSYALIADGVESVLDLFSSVLVWGGLRLSVEPPSAAYPYGRGKAESLAALLIATMLLLAAAGIAAGAVWEIITPHRSPAPFTLLVLLAVVAAKELVFRVLRARGVAIGSAAMHADAWHHRSDAITSMAAFVGISVGLLGGEGWESADDWAALVACGVIAWNGTSLLRAGLGDALDAAAPAGVRTRIRHIAGEVPGVSGIDELRVRRSGLVYFVDIHVEVGADLTVRRGHAIGHDVKQALLVSELPILDVLVHVEPSRRQPD